MKTRFIFLLLLFSNFILIAQDYTHVDKVVEKYPTSFQSIEDFGKRIEKDFTEDADKVRAAYYWIAHHIQYDYKSLRTGRDRYPRIKIKDFENQEDYEYKYFKVYASHVLTYKRGVCEGYSQLLFYLCEYMNIKATVISGNAKNSIHDIGRMPKDTDHAWNAAYFNDQWNLIDATWSTGNEEGTPNHFEFEDSYFCIAPKKLILTHFPEEAKWQLLDKKESKKSFVTRPLFYLQNMKFNMDLHANMRGTIRASKGFVTLKFTAIDTTKVFDYTFDKDKYVSRLKITKEGNLYVAKIPFTRKRNDKLTLHHNLKAFVAFKILPAR